MTCNHRVRHLARLRLVASDPTVSPSHLTVATHPGPVPVGAVRKGSLVDSTDATDPTTGATAINLPIVVVSSVQVLSTPYDPPIQEVRRRRVRG